MQQELNAVLPVENGKLVQEKFLQGKGLLDQTCNLYLWILNCIFLLQLLMKRLLLLLSTVLAKEWDEEYVELIEISKTLRYKNFSLVLPSLDYMKCHALLIYFLIIIIIYRNDVRVTLDEEKNILDTQRKLNRFDL